MQRYLQHNVIIAKLTSSRRVRLSGLNLQIGGTLTQARLYTPFTLDTKTEPNRTKPHLAHL